MKESLAHTLCMCTVTEAVGTLEKPTHVRGYRPKRTNYLGYRKPIAINSENVPAERTTGPMIVLTVRPPLKGNILLPMDLEYTCTMADTLFAFQSQATGIEYPKWIVFLSSRREECDTLMYELQNMISGTATRYKAFRASVGHATWTPSAWMMDIPPRLELKT